LKRLKAGPEGELAERVRIEMVKLAMEISEKEILHQEHEGERR
jgi:hypothetical protein